MQTGSFVSQSERMQILRYEITAKMRPFWTLSPTFKQGHQSPASWADYQPVLAVSLRIVVFDAGQNPQN